MKVRLLMAIAMMALIFGLSDRATADILVENYSGTFGPTTTLGGTALGSNTEFTFNATFDTTTGTGFGPFEVFPVTNFTIDIAGQGSFTGAGLPNSEVNVIVAASGGGYAVGLGDSTISTGFFSFFSTLTPGPNSLNLSGYGGTPSGLPYTIPLSGVSGGLVINDFSNTLDNPVSASLTAVPLPSSAWAGLALMGGICMLGLRRRKATTV